MKRLPVNMIYTNADKYSDSLRNSNTISHIITHSHHPHISPHMNSPHINSIYKHAMDSPSLHMHLPLMHKTSHTSFNTPAPSSPTTTNPSSVTHTHPHLFLYPLTRTAKSLSSMPPLTLHIHPYTSSLLIQLYTNSSLRSSSYQALVHLMSLSAETSWDGPQWMMSTMHRANHRRISTLAHAENSSTKIRRNCFPGAV